MTAAYKKHIAIYFMLLGGGFIPLLYGQDRGRGQNQSGGDPLKQSLDDAFSQMNQALAGEEDFTAEDEYYLGRAVGVNILDSYTPWNNPDLTRYLAKICGALAVNSPRPEIYNGYHVMILDTEDLNAFATPGGHIFITRGLVEISNSEDTLAAVIAHELAHIQLRHGTEIINQLKLTRSLTETGSRAAAIAAREASLEDRKILFGNSVIELTNALFKNGYSRTQEFAADHYAIALLAATGYQPEALIDMLTLLEKASGQDRGLYATHPGPALRIRNAERLIGRYRVADTRSSRQRHFKNK
jgi:predicted Zn-dependent protease